MIYGKEKLLPRVSDVDFLPEYNLLLTFNNGEKKRIDVRPLLDMPAYKPLCEIFETARVEYGTVVWPGDIDISPDKLYLHGEDVDSH